MLKFRTATTQEQMSELSAAALSARLFVPGWNLGATLHDCKVDASYNNARSISVAYLDGKAIGVCVCYTGGLLSTKTKPTAAIFVRKRHRRLGIGTKLLKRTVGGKPFVHGGGISDSKLFFNSFNSVKG